MAFIFLTENDYKVYAQDDILTNLTKNNITNRAQAENAALEEIVSYLDADKYDLTEIFPTILDWNNTADFAAETYVHQNNIIYQAKQLNTGVDPAADVAGAGANWEVKDPRHPIIIRYMVAITLYQLFLSLHGRQIPTHRVDEYDLAKDWLNKLADGKVNPRLPLRVYEEDTTADDVIKAGGLTRKDYQF